MATQIIKDQRNCLYVSKASFWEVAIKVNIGKLTLPFALNVLMQETLSNNIELLEIEMSHILKIISLPLHHRDPFDRLIISQAMIENIPVISSDDQFSLYDMKRVW